MVWRGFIASGLAQDDGLGDGRLARAGVQGGARRPSEDLIGQGIGAGRGRSLAATNGVGDEGEGAGGRGGGRGRGPFLDVDFRQSRRFRRGGPGGIMSGGMKPYAKGEGGAGRDNPQRQQLDERPAKTLCVSSRLEIAERQSPGGLPAGIVGGAAAQQPVKQVRPAGAVPGGKILGQTRGPTQPSLHPRRGPGRGSEDLYEPRGAIDLAFAIGGRIRAACRQGLKTHQ